MVDVPCFVGLDVATAQWESAVRPTGARWAVPHDPHGCATLVERWQALPPPLIVLEATDGLERAATAALATAGLPVVVNPRPARACARATGQLAKTDAWDARAGALCRRDSPNAPAAAGCPDARAARPVRTPPATDGHAHRGAEPPRGHERASPDGHGGAYRLAQRAPGHAG